MKTNDLTMRWVPVTDESGRTHLEAVWIIETEAPSATQAA